MFPYDSITSGVLPPFTPELQRYAERVWERWQLRVIYAEFEIAQVYFYSELYIDLKNGSNAKASKLLDAVQRNNSGVWLNSVKRFGFEVAGLADALTDEYFSVIGTDRETLCAGLEPYIPTTPELAQLSGQFQQICTYIYDFTESVLGYVYGHSAEELSKMIAKKYRILNSNDVFVYYEPALTIFLDDRAQYEALLARKDEVVHDAYTLMRGKFPLDKLEKTFGYPILTEENTAVKIILKSDMDPVLLNTIVGTR